MSGQVQKRLLREGKGRSASGRNSLTENSVMSISRATVILAIPLRGSGKTDSHDLGNGWRVEVPEARKFLNPLWEAELRILYKGELKKTVSGFEDLVAHEISLEKEGVAIKAQGDATTHRRILVTLEFGGEGPEREALCTDMALEDSIFEAMGLYCESTGKQMKPANGS